MHTFALVVQKE